MIAYIGRRFLWIIPVLFTVSVITFFLMHAVPGGPWDREKRLPKGTEDRLNAQYGLDQPLYVQYISWAGGFIQGDLGPSYRYQDRRVNEIVADGFWTTVHLGIMAFILATVVGIPLGIFAALGHNRAPDYIATGVSIVGIATPVFVISILLIVFFAVNLKWFPTGGWKGPEYWVLPTIALAGFPIAIIARYTRASMLEESAACCRDVGEILGNAGRIQGRHGVAATGDGDQLAVLGQPRRLARQLERPVAEGRDLESAERAVPQ